MTSAAAGVLLALAILLVPVPRKGSRSRAGPGATASPSGPGPDPPARRAPMLLVVAVGAVGLACLALLGLGVGLLAASVACPLAGAALHRVQQRPASVRPDAALALALDLAAAALRAGRPLPEALTRAAPVASPGTADLLDRVAGLLRLGADPAAAWTAVPPDGPLWVVAAAATRSAASGVRVAITFERAAAQIRADLAAAAAVRAQRAGVFAMAPLGLCFLPSFVCLGVVPVVVGVAKSALGGLP